MEREFDRLEPVEQETDAPSRRALRASLSLPLPVLGRLMPLLLCVERNGRIIVLGPTLRKLVGAAAAGEPMERHFELRYPAWSPARLAGRDLSDLIGKRVQLVARNAPSTVLRGQALAMQGAGPILINLTFGAGLFEAVREHGLTEADFSSGDLAMELLYLQEAKTVVMHELRGLTERLEAARQTAEELALTDSLTGVANRRAFDAALAQAMAQQRETGTPFALAHLDLDLFKRVNDTRGHGAGDMVLVQVARVLRDEVRRSDTVARVGGDEFVLLLRGRAEPAMLQALCERIIKRIEEPIEFEGEACHVSASIGVALSNGAMTPETLLAQADGALYASKRGGRGRCTVLGFE